MVEPRPTVRDILETLIGFDERERVLKAVPETHPAPGRWLIAALHEQPTKHDKPNEPIERSERIEPVADVSGGAKVDHGSDGTVPLRRSKTLPLWEPFPVTGRVGGFIPWSCIARSVWRAETG